MTLRIHKNTNKKENTKRNHTYNYILCLCICNTQKEIATAAANVNRKPTEKALKVAAAIRLKTLYNFVVFVVSFCNS